MTGAVLLRARGLGLHRRGRAVLQDIDFDLHSGEIVTLIGPNGAGKTTLARVLLGVLPPDRGSLWRAAGLRCGYVPQRMQVEPTLPLTVDRFLTLVVRASAAEVVAALAHTGTLPLRHAPVQDLSGGEWQRVLLARALLGRPHLLVLDEPAQGVDVPGQSELYALIVRLRAETGCAVLLISHDLHLVMAATDRVVCLNQHICCVGAPDMVSRDPSFLALFGDERAGAMALYQHHHHHRHDLHGAVIPTDPEASDGAG